MVTVPAAADGGARSPSTLMYILTLVFAATSHPLWPTGVIAASSVAAFLGRAVNDTSGHPAGDETLVRVADGRLYARRREPATR